MKPGRNRLSLLAAACLVALSCGLLRPGTGEAPSNVPGAETSPPDEVGAALARSLAEGVFQAQSEEDRYQALLSVMRAFNVGVYTQEGEPVLRGAERGEADFYLYEFQLRGMARSLGLGDLWSLEDVAIALDSAGLRHADAPVTADELWTALGSGLARAQQQPDERASLPGLLVIALDAVDPAAEAQAPSADDVRLDALQYWLLIADTTVPFIAAEWPLGGSSTAAGRGLASLRPQQDPCTGIIGDSIHDGWGLLGSILKDVSPPLKKLLNTAAGVLAAHQAALLAYSIEVKALEPQVGPTHYGHETPGKELQFRIQVTMLDDVPDAYVKCGPLAGVPFPPKGPIAGVEVLWLTGELKKHGEVVCGPTCEKTGPDGIATLVFKPKSERQPNQGIQREARGLVEGVARWGTRFGNTYGQVAQYLTPKSGTIAWTVTYHQNFSLEIGGVLTSSDGLTVTFPKTTVPLTSTGTSYEGTGSMQVSIAIPGLPAECTSKAVSPVTVNVRATGADPLSFEISGLAGADIRVSCMGISLGFQSGQIGGGNPVTFQLAADDGATYSYTPQGLSGTIDFILRAQ